MSKENLNDLLEEIETIDEIMQYFPLLVSKKGKGYSRWKTAEILMKTNTFAFIHEFEKLFVRKDNAYVMGGEKVVKSEVERIWGDSATNHDVAEILGHIERSVITSKSVFNENLDEIPLKNGVFNGKTGKFREYTPEDKWLIKINATHNPTATCPKIEKFLFEILREEDVPLFFEVAGFCLYRKYSPQKAIMFLGVGANGKSTAISLLQAFLGKENVSAISLHDLTTNRFAKFQLHNKLAVLYADLTSNALRNTGIFKILTGGDMISADKKFGDYLSFENYAKLIYSANVLPKPGEDDSDAFFRRWVLIDFPNVFEGAKCNANLLSELMTDEELSGFLNKAIEGLKRVLSSNGFSRLQTTQAIRDDYIKRSDPVRHFAIERLEFDAEGIITKEEIYNLFVRFCNDEQMIPANKNRFGMELQKFIQLEECRPIVDGRQKKAWKGMRIK